jgi:DNA repair protein RecO (recombination protein O)
MQQRESAICLRASDYSETSQVLHFFTRGAGVVRLLAKGAKRKKSSSGGAVDLMSEGDLVFIASKSQALGTLVEFTETASRAAMRTDAGRLNAGLLMIELAGELMPEADPHPEAFDLLHHGLARLGEAGSPVPAVLAYFQWRMLHHAGLLGEMERCVVCGRQVAPAVGAPAPADVWFSSSQGGLVCDGCEGGLAEKFHVDAATLAGLSALAAAQAGRKVPLPDEQAHGVNRMLVYHAQQQLGKTLKMARYAVPAG